MIHVPIYEHNTADGMNHYNRKLVEITLRAETVFSSEKHGFKAVVYLVSMTGMKTL